MTSKEDLAILQQTMPTGVEGVKALEKFMREGNGEMKKLLYDECEVLLECRYCRNIFRSVINFVSHKRSYCRTSHVAVMAASNGAATVTEDDSKTETATKKRIGQIGVLSKRLEPTMVPIKDSKEFLALFTLPRVMKELPQTSIEDGFQKVLGQLPCRLAKKEAVPDDRTVVVMPQDNSSRYKDMELRSRKAPITDKDQYREFSHADIKIIENFEKHDVRCGDFVKLECDHPMCANVRAFHSLPALAYHCSLRHTQEFRTESGDRRWPCLLCSRNMWTLDGVRTHLVRVHPGVKQEHVQKRAEEEKSKPGKKPTNPARRSRSMSVETDNEQTTMSATDSREVRMSEKARLKKRQVPADILPFRRGGKRPNLKPQQKRQRDASDAEDQEEADEDEDDDGEEYGEPPVLQPQGKMWRMATPPENDDDEDAEEEEEEKKSKSRSSNETSPDDVKEEEEEDYEEGEEEEDIKYNSVEGCLESLLDSVCTMMGEETVTRRRRSEKQNTVKKSAVPTPVQRNSSGKKRGRPRKSDIEKDSPSSGKPGRPKKSFGSGSGGSGSLKKKMTDSGEKRVKRAYVKRADRERMEAEERARRKQEKRHAMVGNEEGEEEEEEEMEDDEPLAHPSGGSTSKPSASSASAIDSSTAMRPARDRKRPHWMMGYETGSGGAAGSSRIVDADESIEEPGEESEEEDGEREGKSNRDAKPAKQETPVLPRSAAAASSTSTPTKKSKSKFGSTDDVVLFTPRAGKVVQDRINMANGASASSSSSSSRKRKQNLGQLTDEDEDLMIVGVSDPMTGPKKSDLTSVPVYLSEQQQRIFFAGLIHMKDTENDEKKDWYECQYCHERMPNVRDGRRHMVSHLRVMRLRCGLCGAGAFFCIDMRNHLQMRGCPELSKAPAHMIRAGQTCMTKEHADELTFVAHSGSPGRALFTSGKIVSIHSSSPYLPDPVIEEKILGPTRVPPRSASPRKPQHKFLSVLKDDKGIVSLAVQRSPTAAAAAAAA
ncbi:hypothetical protein PFISCL1PPCAC_23104, partial [Pristionchus fissidentatus]